MRSKDDEAKFSVEAYIPKFKLNFDLPLIPKITDLMPEITGQITSIQDFSGGDATNQRRLSVLPAETWLLVFFHLKPKDIVAMMLSCKFFGEITNNQEIRFQLADAKRSAGLMTRFEELLPKKTPLAELSFLRPQTLQMLHFPMTRELKYDVTEVIQTGEQGFSMKPS